MDERDPRIRSFLRQAAAVIAMHQGLNPVSQAQLKLLAENLHLSGAEYEWAISQVATGDRIDELSRYEQAFLDYLVRKFERLSEGILPLKVENKAVDAARRKFQIAAARAHQLIDRACELTHVRSISKSDAESFIREVILRYVDQAQSLDQVPEARLIELGRQWGIDAEQVRMQVAQAIQDNASAARRIRRTRLSYSLGLLLVGIAAALALRQFAARSQRAAPPSNSDPPAAAHLDTPVPLWWPKDWIRTHHLRIVDIPSLDRLVQSIADSTDPQNRCQRYQELAELWPTASSAQQEFLWTLLNELLWADPQRQQTGEWLENLTSRYDRGPEAWPVQSRDLEVQLQTWEIAAAFADSTADDLVAFDRPDLIRAAELRKRRTVQNPARQGGELGQALQADWLLEIWYRISRADRPQSASALAAIGALYVPSRDRLRPDLFQPLLSQTVKHLLDLDPSGWRLIQEPLLDVLSTAGPKELEDWVDRVRSAADQEFHDWLGRSILTQNGSSAAASLSRAEIVQGLAALKTQWVAGRWGDLQQFDARLSQLEGELRNRLAVDGATSPIRVAQAAALVNATLELLLQLEGSGETPVQLEAPDLEAIADRFPAVTSAVDSALGVLDPATASDYRTLEQTLGLLADDLPQNEEFRKTGLERLARLAGRIETLSYREAVILARYFLREKSEDEWVVAEKSLPALRHWAILAVAVHDELESSDCSIDLALTVAQLLIDQQIELGEDPQWKSAIRARMFEATARRLAASLQSTDVQAQAWNQLSPILTELYRARAGMLSEGTIGNESSAAGWLISAVEAQTGETLEAAHLQAWLDRHLSTEIPKCVASLHRMIATIIAEAVIQYPHLETDLLNGRKQLEASLRVGGQGGAQLLQCEIALLHVLSLLRRERVRSLLEN